MDIGSSGSIGGANLNPLSTSVDGAGTAAKAALKDLPDAVAEDLRVLISALKIANTLERNGDLAKNIAKRALAVAETAPMQPLTRSIERMGRLVSVRLRDADTGPQWDIPGASGLSDRERAELRADR